MNYDKIRKLHPSTGSLRFRETRSTIITGGDKVASHCNESSQSTIANDGVRLIGAKVL